MNTSSLLKEFLLVPVFIYNNHKRLPGLTLYALLIIVMSPKFGTVDYLKNYMYTKPAFLNKQGDKYEEIQ